MPKYNDKATKNTTDTLDTLSLRVVGKAIHELLILHPEIWGKLEDDPDTKQYFKNIITVSEEAK